MKKIYLSAFILASFFSLQAQITLTQKTHGIVAGDAFHFVFAQPVEEGLNGENITWDFSKLIPNSKTLTSNMLNSIETTKGGEMNNANVAIEEFGNQFYFADSKTGILDYGVAINNTIIKYDVPAIKLQFPLSYSQKVSGSFSGTQTTGEQSTSVSGTYEIFADAYGKLILPDGVTLNKTLRVKQTRVYNSCNCKEIVYRWYITNLHYPVLVITKYADAAGKETSSQTAYHLYTESKEKSQLASTETEENSSITTYPNPWKESLNIEYTLTTEEDVQIKLYDTYGKLVDELQSKQKQTIGKHTYQVTDKYPAGIYILKVIHGNEKWVKKLVKEN